MGRDTESQVLGLRGQGHSEHRATNGHKTVIFK
jgi:hypothetical protein